MQIRNFLEQLFAALGVDASPEMALDEALIVIKEKLAPLKEVKSKMIEREIHDLIAKALGPGSDDLSSKLYPDEKEWAINLARDQGLDVARAFIRMRPKVAKEKAPVIDEIQDSINRQVGVSREVFLKYSDARSMQSSRTGGGTDIVISAEQRSINQQCGVSDETFRRYSAAPVAGR